MPAQGIFNRLDPFFGNQDDPQSLHKYAYVHGDPVNGIDPSGLFSVTELISVMFSKMKLIGITAGLGGVVSKLLGGSFIQGIVAGAQLGAGLQIAFMTGGWKGLAEAVGMGALSFMAEYVALIMEDIFGLSDLGNSLRDAGQFLWAAIVAFSDGVFDASLDSLASLANAASNGLGIMVQFLQIMTTILRAAVTEIYSDEESSGLEVMIRLTIEILFQVALTESFGSRFPRRLKGRISRITDGGFARIIHFNPGDNVADAASRIADQFADNLVDIVTPFFSRFAESLGGLARN